MSPANAIALAFVTAFQRYPELRQTWVNVSWAIGGKLPESLLTVSVQRIGELDILLRAIEDDFSASDTSTPNMLAYNYQAMHSEAWVGAIYEVVRLLNDRKLGPDSEAFRSLARDLRLVRVPLEKHELAGDRKLTAPLQLMRTPSRGEDRDFYTYDKSDPARAHIMPTGVSARGSSMWQVTDATTQKSYWIERRALSERVVEIWSR